MSVQHDPNVSMIPSVGGGPIVAMSGGGGGAGGNNAGNNELTIENLNKEIAEQEARNAEQEAEILSTPDNATPAAPAAPSNASATPAPILNPSGNTSSAAASNASNASSAPSAAASNASAAPSAAPSNASAPAPITFKLSESVKFFLGRQRFFKLTSEQISKDLNRNALSFLNEIGKTVNLPTGAEPKIQIDIYKYTPPTMRWAAPPSKNSIFLKQSNGTEILLNTLDCISFYREHEPYTIAYIIQFLPDEGNEPPNQFTFCPFRKDTNKWATTNYPITRTGWFVTDSTSLNSIKIMNEPPIPIPTPTSTTAPE